VSVRFDFQPPRLTRASILAILAPFIEVQTCPSLTMPTKKPHPPTLKDTQQQARRHWRSFEEARALTQSLGLKSIKAWLAWAHSGARPADIPVTPSSAYRGKGWVSWGDWLGTRNRRGGWRSFEEARALTRSLGLKRETDWFAWTKSEARPADIPCHPQAIYQDQGWVSWDDWLGTRNRRGRYRPYEEARAFVRSLGLAGQIAWKAWCKTSDRPPDIPVAAPVVYRDKGWVNWSDWLGTRHRRGGWRSFEAARAFARRQGLTGEVAWKAWAKSDACPVDIPVTPHGVYRNQGWAGWADWLGHDGKG